MSSLSGHPLQTVSAVAPFSKRGSKRSYTAIQMSGFRRDVQGVSLLRSKVEWRWPRSSLLRWPGALPWAALALGSGANSYTALASPRGHGHPSRLAVIPEHEGWQPWCPLLARHPHSLSTWTSLNVQVLSSISQAGAVPTHRCCSPACLRQTQQPHQPFLAFRS